MNLRNRRLLNEDTLVIKSAQGSKATTSERSIRGEHKTTNRRKTCRQRNTPRVIDAYEDALDDDDDNENEEDSNGSGDESTRVANVDEHVNTNAGGALSTREIDGSITGDGNESYQNTEDNQTAIEDPFSGLTANEKVAELANLSAEKVFKKKDVLISGKVKKYSPIYHFFNGRYCFNVHPKKSKLSFHCILCNSTTKACLGTIVLNFHYLVS
jgi:hypothetical protein